MQRAWRRLRRRSSWARRQRRMTKPEIRINDEFTNDEKHRMRLRAQPPGETLDGGHSPPHRAAVQNWGCGCRSFAGVRESEGVRRIALATWPRGAGCFSGKNLATNPRKKEPLRGAGTGSPVRGLPRLQRSSRSGWWHRGEIDPKSIKCGL
jgi:hypothetical protein